MGGCYIGGTEVMDVFGVDFVYVDLKKGNLFVLSWERVRQVRWGSISSELLMCGGSGRCILLFPLLARCLDTLDVCILHMFVFYVCCSDCVGVCGEYLLCSGHC